MNATFKRSHLSLINGRDKLRLPIIAIWRSVEKTIVIVHRENFEYTRTQIIVSLEIVSDGKRHERENHFVALAFSGDDCEFKFR